MITSFECKGQTYTLKVPIELHTYQEGEYYFAENEFLYLSGCGKSQEEAIQDAKEDLEKAYSLKFEDHTEEIDDWLIRMEMFIEA